MMKKRTCLVCIAIGVIATIMGFALMDAVEEMSFYDVSANMRDIIEMSPAFLLAVGFICAALGVVLLLVNLSSGAKPATRRWGRLLDKETGVYDIVTIEFENGARERLVVSDKRKTIVSVNDVGIFTTKGRYLIGFERATY